MGASIERTLWRVLRLAPHLALHLVVALMVVTSAWLARPAEASERKDMPVRQADRIHTGESESPPSIEPGVSAESDTAPITPTLPIAGSVGETHPVAFLPLVAGLPGPCPVASDATYDTIGIYNGAPYKGNRLTDENVDFRLSLLGYAAVNKALGFVTYNGSPDPNSPRLGMMFQPHRRLSEVKFVRAYQVYTWAWDESTAAPYGSRGPLARDWDVTVVDLATKRGETVSIPARDPDIAPFGYKAMVLYAGPNEITLAYMSQDNVVAGGAGYVVNLMHLCVDPNLVATYRAQLTPDGKRATMQLPALKNEQPLGTALGVTITLAIRDGGRYMDPRSKGDWWAGLQP